MSVAARLHQAIAAVCPIDGVSIITLSPFVATFTPTTGATPQEITNAQAILESFDPSDTAQTTWEENQNPERKTLREQAASAIQGNNDFLAIVSPTNAQAIAQIRRLTQQNNAIIRRLIQID